MASTWTTRRSCVISRCASKKGVSVLLSNSSVPEVHALYAEGFERIEIFANRAINSNAAKRGKVAEALIW